MNEIEAECSGTVIEVFAQNGKAGRVRPEALPHQEGLSLARDVQEDPHRQPRRDRAAHPARLPRARREDRRRPLGGRLARAARALRRRGGVHRPAPSAKSYLNIPAIISAAEITAADAIHPGYGFLSENAEFARLCEKCDVTFIGPTPEAMRAWGDKVTARTNAARFGIPLLAGSGVLEGRRRRRRARRTRIGFPVILKASGGGGGRGMRIVRERARDARRPSRAPSTRPRPASRTPTSTSRSSSSGRGTSSSRSSPTTTAASGRSGERECSLQRRHQKVIEEAPSPAHHRREAAGDGRGHPPGDPRDGLHVARHARVPHGRGRENSPSSR